MKCRVRVVFEDENDRYYPQYENENGGWEFFRDPYDDGRIWHFDLETSIDYAQDRRPYKCFEIRWMDNK